MKRLVNGDKLAFEAIYDRYGDLVYSTALRVLRDPHIAEDMSQEIFVRLWRKPASYVAERGRFLTWLISVTRNRAVDEIRSRGRRQRYETASPEEPRTVRAALAELPPEQRQAIELAYFGGHTQQEIAERLGQPLGTVKTRIRLGMQKMRAALAPQIRSERI
jgi:RNA polymerase sigma-70 factor (ECF subfamily)